jgi:hypothetical protein
MANTTGKKFGGRKKDTPNKDTKDLRQKVDILLSEKWEQLENDLKELSPKDRIDTYIKLMEYALPKLNRTELKGTDKLEDILNMTSKERQIRIKELTNQLKKA